MAPVARQSRPGSLTKCVLKRAHECTWSILKFIKKNEFFDSQLFSSHEIWFWWRLPSLELGCVSAYGVTSRQKCQLYSENRWTLCILRISMQCCCCYAIRWNQKKCQFVTTPSVPSSCPWPSDCGWSAAWIAAAVCSSAWRRALGGRQEGTLFAKMASLKPMLKSYSNPWAPACTGNTIFYDEKKQYQSKRHG